MKIYLNVISFQIKNSLQAILPLALTSYVLSAWGLTLVCLVGQIKLLPPPVWPDFLMPDNIHHGLVVLFWIEYRPVEIPFLHYSYCEMNTGAHLLYLTSTVDENGVYLFFLLECIFSTPLLSQLVYAVFVSHTV